MTNDEEKVKVKYFAFLKEIKKVDEESVILQQDETGRSLFYRLFTDLPPNSLDRMRLAINEDFVAMDTQLTAGDEVVFIPPVAGG